ncbi:hypothetical protein RSOLAG22IIIB_00018 [Rhizoctonia solani]|uniref:Zn(2)-C6 fungal-type domain-containing protein n=1 Tax=Rhizoctonia solani TaxID=456999 RepID=A0A0K6FK87_9AGAM|nr:hypothetical protein RSOLAG22IIIB_00018 [Rhizoctonia solani]
MSHPYYSDDYSQHYYSPDSYDAPVQSHTPAYDNNSYYNQAVTPSAHVVDNSPVQSHSQSHTYSDVNYTPDTTTNHYSSYAPAQHVVPHYPDSANQVPHQVAPAQTWAEPGRYTEVTTTQPNDLYEQRRGSCTSSTDENNWYPQNQASTGHYGHQQPVYAQQNYYPNYYNNALQYRQQQPESMSFGMYSPTQYMRTQELARHVPPEPVNQPEPTPYGTLPMHETRARSERRSSDAYQTLDNDSTDHTHTAQFSPFIQSQPPPTESSAPSSPQEGSDSSEPPAPRDLYVQQRFAAGYQHVLQAQQELKYQLSGQLEQLEASVMNNQTHAHHHHHRRHHSSHHRQGSSSSRTRLPHTPVVPSQARERPLARAHTGSKGEEKKAPSKKPALACLFCRKRKIACGPPSPDNPDRTCNQCARRKQVCEYPTESRRGIRKSQKEPAHEEPTVHKFVTGQAGSSKQKAASKGGVGPIRRVRRKHS